MGKEQSKELDWEELGKVYKEWRSKNPIKKSNNKIRQRTKKAPITVEETFPAVCSALAGIKLKVTATPEAWQKFHDYALDHPDWFGLDFLSHFATPAILSISNQNRPRGSQKGKYPLVKMIKIQAGSLYPFFLFWIKQKENDWPSYLQKLIGKAKKQGVEQVLRTAKGEYDPKILTAYCMEDNYGKYASKIGIKSFFEFDGERESIENFYLTYIMSDKAAKRIVEDLIKGKTLQEVADLAYTNHVLRNIFQSLKVI